MLKTTKEILKEEEKKQLTVIGFRMSENRDMLYPQMKII
jgi:hypothetical protein